MSLVVPEPDPTVRSDVRHMKKALPVAQIALADLNGLRLKAHDGSSVIGVQPQGTSRSTSAANLPMETVATRGQLPSIPAAPLVS
jgi:hypothetical protein